MSSVNKRNLGTAELVAVKLQKFMGDLLNLMERPTFALAAFIIGIAFTIFANKETNKILEFMELWGYSFLEEYRTQIVLVVLWLNIMIFGKVTRWILRCVTCAWRYALRRLATMLKVENQCTCDKSKL